MQIPTVWTRDIWRRAAAPVMPTVDVAAGRMTSEATAHRADYVGGDRWVVDWLPGRQLTRNEAKAAMRIAVDPHRLEVERWASLLGMTPAEARGYVAMPAGGVQ